MLNYSVKVGELEEEANDTLLSGQGIGANPFPGLRPFTVDECHLYFGREGQVDEILVKLSKHRCVTVMGYSGSGKSSLMNCGLVPVLLGGFMSQSSPYWRIITARPGTSPIANLVNSIVDHLIGEGRIEAKDAAIHKAIINSVLRSGPDGLVEVSKYLQSRKGENIFFAIDQFEELFRYKEAEGEEFANDATAYVNLILTAVRKSKEPIYVSLNMRSDFIGECSLFPGLTQMINESNYLVPQMSREQKRMAIEGPIAVGGGKISSRLLKRLLSDVGDNQDQLPILQHALMRTWDYWIANHEAGEAMDIRHYNAIGKIGQALSLHANEAYDELTSREKEIAEILFKNVTERNLENQGLRRPVRVDVVAELAEASESEVIKVVDHFRKPGRSFLMPGTHVSLMSNSIIELSHESMMRIWTRLTSWVDEEFESAQMYKRISEAAAMYQIGRTGLWRPPDLQLALNWQKKQKPTRTWAQRYDEAFERAVVFLDTSRITYEAELKNQEMLQRRMLRRSRVTNIILVVFLLFAISLFFYGLTQQLDAERQAQIALTQQKAAELARVDATKQKEIAEQRTTEVQLQAEQLRRANQLVTKALNDARVAQAAAVRNLEIAEEQRRIAISEKNSADSARTFAVTQYERAETALKQSNRLLYLSVAQSIEAKSVSMDDPQLAGLLAMQGYLFHTKYEGNKYDPYVFSGLYYAITKQSNLSYNAIKAPGNYRNRMFALAMSKTSNTFYTTGNDGRIFKGDIDKLTADNIVASNPFPNRVLALSSDEQYLVNGSDSSFVQIYKIGDNKPEIVRGHRGFVNDIKFLPDNSGFISVASDKTIRFTDHRTGQSRILNTLPFDLKAIDISTDGKTLVGASLTGQIVSLDLATNQYKVLIDETPSRVLSISFHPTKQLIAYGVEVIDEHRKVVRGLVKLMDLGTKRIKELTGHKAGVSDVEFSPDGLLLASAGLDRKLQMWVVDKEEDLPILMDNNNGNIWDITFTKGSNFLLAACNSGEVRVWPTDTKYLAERVCPGLKRNLTPEEWTTWVSKDLPYETTCASLLINDF
jgi:WD40 repeat protein